MATVKDVHRWISDWAPKEIAWERDNVGLQVGNMETEVHGVLVCLDCTQEVVREARKKKANLIVSHHPLLFRPPKTIATQSGIGAIIRDLISGDINLYSAHTNLDFARGGTSFALAEALGLADVDFLHKSYRVQKKIVTFVPEDRVDPVRDAMAKAGAGTLGNYELCAFSTVGTGSFKGNGASNPVIGKRGQLEKVKEVRLEMVADQWDMSSVVRAMKGAHPYEEVAYDVYGLENTSNDFGMGIIGTLEHPMRLTAFLAFIKKRLNIEMLRYSATGGKMIRRVAACGGAGIELLESAIAQGADAFVTADVKYHDFQSVSGKLVLIDAGHYETEHPVVNALVERLKYESNKSGERLPIASSRVSTNPIFYT